MRRWVISVGGRIRATRALGSRSLEVERAKSSGDRVALWREMVRLWLGEGREDEKKGGLERRKSKRWSVVVARCWREMQEAFILEDRWL